MKNNQPMAEVFGFPIDNTSPTAVRYRTNQLCPFNNKVPNCTKDKAESPLGVCSVFNGSDVVVTCPVRFRQDWLIIDDAAAFFFASDVKWTTLTEVRLNDANGKSAGNIDVLLVAYDENGKVIDFGSLEIQAVYISGNVRNPFEEYMKDQIRNANMSWNGPNYPRPDFLSSSRKRLAPQLMFKGGILHQWNKKMAVALDVHFMNTLPKLEEVSPDEASVVWLVYECRYDQTLNTFRLEMIRAVYTTFHESLEQITKPVVGDVGDFLGEIQSKLDKARTPPINQTIVTGDL
ncbi:NotI family restriction endonuclease [soil metagenome]